MNDDYINSLVKQAEENYFIDLYTSSNIPKRYFKKLSLKVQPCDEQAFNRLIEIYNAINKFTEDGNNLNILSNNSGNGKTSMAIEILKKYITNNAYTCKKLTGYFVAFSTFMSLHRSSVNWSDDRQQLSFVNRKVHNAKLLILDDFITSTLSEYEFKVIFELLEHRTSNMLSTIITSNYSKEQLVQRLDSKLVTRILGYAETIELQGKSLRGIV